MADIVTTKSQLRTQLRQARRDHVAGLPAAVSALVFRAPPGPVRDRIASDAVIGLYHATDSEAPTGGYARHFLEAGHRIALPRISDGEGVMAFHDHTDPYDGSDLEKGPHGILQPGAAAEELVPDVLFVPLIGFTRQGHRLGQGGGYYDRWLARHPETTAIGLGWDMQELDALPLEDHDMPLSAIITPTRIIGLPEDAANA